MIGRAVSALRDPGAFFRDLKVQPRQRLAPYLVLLVAALVGSGVAVLSLARGQLPQVAEARALLERAGIGVEWVAAALLLCAPLSALFTWLVLWIPIRIGAGPAERLPEVAAWSQLPQIGVAPFQALLVWTGLGAQAVYAVVSLGAVLWSATFVYAGVRELGGGRAWAASLLHAVVWFVPTLLSLSSNAHGTSTGTLLG